jgi:hypothetical protein
MSMSVAALKQDEATRIRTDAVAPVPDGNPGVLSSVPAERHGLSTDYLNHYSGILMLIEMASFEPSIVDEIGRWQPIGYREYFEKSPLRRASSALCAYDELAADSRLAFEQIVQGLDKLTLGAIVALQPPCHPHGVPLIAEVVGPAIRRLIDRAAAFLNSGGAGCWDGCEADRAQRMTDWLIAKSA